MSVIGVKLTFVTAAFATVLSVSAANSFRVTPYVQHPKPTAMTVMWLAQEAGAASITYWKAGSLETKTLSAVCRDDLSDDKSGVRFVTDDALEYCLAPELGYDMDPNGGNDKQRGGGWDLPATVPWQYRVRLTGLQPDTEYGYKVQLSDGVSYENKFRTSPDPKKWRGVKFIYFSDSETEPGDNPPEGKTSDWDIPEGSPRSSAKYFASQTEAYAANIRAAVDFGAELIVMAGDLAQRGSRQCDWDEFWRHNAGPLNDPAASIPILASPGNHDYWSYNDGGNVGITKYLSYFEYEPNQADVGRRQHELFHRVDYGPVTFLFMDANNGNDDVLLEDTSRNLHRTDADGSNKGCIAPDFNPGSVMYNWLEEQLRDAQKNSAFTFVVCHHCPYSVGYHGGQIHEIGQGGDEQTGRALRVLEPLFHKYGVDGWLCGHDEMMERSEIEGVETLPDGTEVPHKFCVWDMGIAGDGLRGNVVYDNVNPKEKYRAHVNCPEVYETRNGKNVLVEGGKHYGHLEVTIDQTEDGSWRATFDPVYIFYSQDASGNTVYGGVRHYADKVVRISNRCKGAPPAPQPVTKTSVDVSAYVPTKMPQALLTTFWSDACSRGFSWQTDASVTETKLWILKGEYDQDDGNTFVGEGTLVEGTCEALSSATGDPAVNGHRVHVENLEPGATYSCRFGGNGHYACGQFTVAAAPRTVRIVNFGDTQTKDATGLYKAENAVAAAVRTAGGAKNVDLVICGGDLVDVSPLKNANHVAYGTDVPASGTWTYMYWKWGLMTDLLAPYFPGVPWVAVPGNHDYKYYLKTTEVNAFTTGMEGVGCGCSSFDIGNVHIVNLPYLDTWKDATAPKYKAAFDWLDVDLKATSARWKVVCVHWGPYTSGDHSQEAGTKNLTWALAPVLSANHVDLVLQAHDHAFSKSVPYRWDTNGYTGSATDETVLNLNPETVRFGGEMWDANPAGTYYVSSGCAGPRTAEEPDYPDIDGPKSYTKRDPKIVMGKVAVKSDYFEIGHDASSDFHQFAPASDGSKGRQSFGILKVNGERLSYDFYVAEEDGTVTLIDKLRVMKGSVKLGCELMLK